MTERLQTRDSPGEIILVEREWGRLGKRGMCWSPGPTAQPEFYPKRATLRTVEGVCVCVCVCVCVNRDLSHKDDLAGSPDAFSREQPILSK